MLANSAARPRPPLSFLQESRETRPRHRSKTRHTLEESRFRFEVQMENLSFVDDVGTMISLLQNWDADNDGFVSPEDFQLGLSRLGFQISIDEARTLCKAIDPSTNYKICLANLKPPEQQQNTNDRISQKSPTPANDTNATDQEAEPNLTSLAAARRALARSNAEKPSRPTSASGSPSLMAMPETSSARESDYSSTPTPKPSTSGVVASRADSPHAGVPSYYWPSKRVSRPAHSPTVASRRSSVCSNAMRSSAASYQASDIDAIPYRLAGLLMENHARVIDLFRSWDEDEDGGISRKDFSRGLCALGLDERTDEMEIDELFATLDLDGDGMLEYEELNRMIRVGIAHQKSGQIRSAARSKAAVMSPLLAERSARETWRGPRYVETNDAPLRPVEEVNWPPLLRQLLMRERKRVLDLFRHWEDSEGGNIAVEHFKAGLHVLGHQVRREFIVQFFESMGGERPSDGGEMSISFRELHRQLRVASQRAASTYTRAAARRGVAIESSAPRGATLSDINPADLNTPVMDPTHTDMASAMLLASPRGAPNSPSFTVNQTNPVLDARVRAKLAAEEAAKAAQEPGKQALQSCEMMLQQWSRQHYSGLLTELRKWELRPGGEIDFDTFADSLVSLGFDIAGRWRDLEQLWTSWSPNELGTHHWLKLRALMTTGRLVKVNQRKYSTRSYYKTASRAGEGFGNRSSPRFRDLDPTLLGPGKYHPENKQPQISTVAKSSFSGKFTSQGDRFHRLKLSSERTPGPGRYKPRHTLVDSRHAL